VTELVLRPGAAAEHIKLQLDGERALHVGSTQVHQGQGSRLRSFAITFGGALARNDLDVALEGSDSECQLDGLYMARGRQLVDNHTSIRHLHPRCASREVYKGIIAGSAHAVFNGKVFVAPEAQKTDGKQTNRNLLLSDDAKVDTKPQLEIFADDVKCTHGATVGRLDQMGLFYLRSRGLPEPAARKILTYAFAAEILEQLPLPELRERLEGLVMSRLDVEQG
jgi:Fe-S cluster assembly protein SufD